MPIIRNSKLQFIPQITEMFIHGVWNFLFINDDPLTQYQFIDRGEIFTPFRIYDRINRFTEILYRIIVINKQFLIILNFDLF